MQNLVEHHKLQIKLQNLVEHKLQNLVEHHRSQTLVEHKLHNLVEHKLHNLVEHKLHNLVEHKLQNLVKHKLQNLVEQVQYERAKFCSFGVLNWGSLYRVLKRNRKGSYLPCKFHQVHCDLQRSHSTTQGPTTE